MAQMKPPVEARPEPASGVAAALGAFLLWGFNPVYFKLLSHVPAFEILLHRMVWSFFLLLPIVLLTHRRQPFVQALSERRTLLTLLGTTALLAVNWFTYIWAINNNRILQASLGYYINPLINVVLGMVFLRERLRPAQTAAVVLAAVSVVYLTFEIGSLPWIALVLAFSLGFYGLIRKTAPVGALVGLAVETLLLVLPAAAGLVYLGFYGSGAFLRADTRTDLLLLCAGPVTAVPLLLFTMGARAIHLTTMGILQYIAPSCTFALAVFVYGEAFRSAQLWTFVLIWAALCIYTSDSAMHYRRRADPS
jgi:chloramphenicol-sensitive protein RarD